MPAPPSKPRFNMMCQKQYNHNATALHGIIALRQGERETAQEAFTKSIAQADEILAKTPDYYSALDAKGLALCGLALRSTMDDVTVRRKWQERHGLIATRPSKHSEGAEDCATCGGGQVRAEVV